MVVAFVAAVACVTGTIQLTTLPPATGIKFLPNMYEVGYTQTSLLTFMGTMIGTMAATGITLSDFGLDQNSPFPLQIVNYTYFTGSPTIGFTAELTGPGVCLMSVALWRLAIIDTC